MASTAAKMDEQMIETENKLQAKLDEICRPEKQDPSEMRGKIAALETEMRKLPQASIPIRHYFAPGIYLREMSMPKDALVVGKIHKTEHYCVLAKGVVIVATENGKQTYRSPAVIHAMPGAKRTLFALSDVVWINVHHNPDNVSDLEKIEDQYVADSFEEYIGYVDKLKLQGGA